MKSIVFIFLLNFLYFGLQAQDLPDDVKTYIEDFYSIQSGSGESIDVNIVFDQLLFLLENPININQIDRQGLNELYLLTPLQIDALLNYRQRLGPLQEVYELQAIPHFDRATIKRILPFIDLQKQEQWTKKPLKNLLKDARSTFYLRYNRILEDARGFIPKNDSTPPAFEGSPEQLFTRFNYRLAKKFSIGFTAEKDAGETLFKGSNPNGPDYFSAHLYLENPIKKVRRFAIGDYNLSLGQGLILHSGFGGGKSSFVTNIKKGGNAIRPHTSIAETTFLRGAAAEIELVNDINLVVFYSRRNIDGNIAQPDTLLGDVNASTAFFTSINNSGLHRTENEIEDESVLEDEIVGGRIGVEKSNYQFRINLFRERFSSPLNRRDDLYNLFVPETDEYQFASVDYTYIGKSWHFFGETAINGFGWATLNGLLFSPVRNLQMSLMYRYFHPEYFSLNANAFGEVQQASNEHGFYAGLQWNMKGPWKLAAYADVWRHPWLRFNVDAPSHGNEFLIRLEYYKKRKFDAYLQFRTKTRGFNVRGDEDKAAQVLPQSRQQLRFHIAHKVNKNLELRYRAEWVRAQIYDQGPEHGYLLYADAIYKPIGFPLSFTSRIAIYNSDGFLSRLYAYENNLLYTFSIPAYFEEGTRAYLNVRWKVFRNLTWEARIAQTWRNQAESIGSAQNEILGDRRTEFGTQIKLSF